ncbi:small subunit ribosomal protein S3Ae [Spatholobus suberectus]|nr:small subunit ribosomal protein S3Ae [Spatholobus suberectus]
MGTKSIFVSFLLCSFLLHLHSPEGVVAQEVAKSESEAVGEPEQREALEIIIGGGGSPAPSPECPPPPPKLNSRLVSARRVLLRFKSLINDSTCYTANWNENSSPCTFNGIRCAQYPNSSDQAVAGVDLNGARVAGRNGCGLPLTGLVDDLPDLTFFHVNSNNFSGGVPSGITKFRYFFELDLSNNKIGGQFPMDAIKSNLLVFLDLRFNGLTGPIPSDLFQRDLDVIFVNNNKFSQSLPENFGSTPARYLTFANNQLSGQIPRSVGFAPNLTEVLFLGNKFDGCLPYEIGYLKKAVVFDVSKNFLTGPIPLSFGCLKSIQYLNLAHNKFYGVVPDNLCQIASLRNNGNLSLEDNYFKEIGPSCWSLIKSKVLDVSRNCIPGLPNQKSPQECHEFYYKTKKPCPNPNSFYYVPCKAHWGMQSSDPQATGPPSEPVTYKTLKPHRLRL